MRQARLTVDFGSSQGPMDIGRMSVGQGGLSSSPMWADRVPEIRALRPRLVRFWMQEYFRPLPEPGRTDFSSLDRAIAPVLETGAVPLASLNFKPKALFPTIDERVLTPTDWRAWEDLIEACVRHFVQRGHSGWYWEIIGETDCGEGGGEPYLGTPETYPEHYTHTACAVLRADPRARVGGPALGNVNSPILPALLRHCAAADVPLHFVSWHRYSNSPRDFGQSVDYVKDLLRGFPALDVETILDEWSWNFGVNPQAADPRWTTCFIPEVIWQMKRAGLDASCYYQIRDWHVDIDEFRPFFSERGAAFMARWWNRMPQPNGLFDFQNTLRPTYFSFKLLSRLAGERVAAESSDDAVHALASRDPVFRMDQVLFWNFSAEPVRTAVSLTNAAPDGRVVPFALDTLAASHDENVRIRPEPEIPARGASFDREIEIAPWGVHMWYVHGASWDIGS